MAEQKVFTNHTFLTVHNTSGYICNVTSGPGYQWLEAATSGIRQYYIWAIFIFGFPGNITSVIVVLKMSRHRAESSLFFVALLAIVDNTAIVLKVIENQAQNRKLPMDDTRCRILFFFGLTVSTYANWLLVTLAVERYTAVKFPLRVSLAWTMRKSIGIVSSIFVFISLVHLHLFWDVIETEGYSCSLTLEGDKFQSWLYIGSLLYAIIPACCFIVFNILIIDTVRTSSKMRKSLYENTTASMIDDRKYDQQITAMLVIVATMFVVLSMPRCVFMITYKYWITEPCTLDQSRKRFLDVLTSNVADTNHAVNFYLYFLAGQRFRQAYRMLFIEDLVRHCSQH